MLPKEINNYIMIKNSKLAKKSVKRSRKTIQPKLNEISNKLLSIIVKTNT